MTFTEPDTIDLVTISRDGTAMILTAVATEQLTRATGHLVALERKLKAYREAIVSGLLAEKYPESATLKKVVCIEHYYPLTRQAEEILARYSRSLRSDGIRLITRQASFNPLRFLVELFKKPAEREW
jgi:hypothetical protein